MRVYLAAPLFTPHERELNLKITGMIERMSKYEVFLPQRDGILLGKHTKTSESVAELKRQVFIRDVQAIERSDIVFAVLNGRVVDEGVAFEMGFAFAKGLKCWAYKDDWRQLLETGDNPMLEGSIDKRFNSIEEIENYFSP